MRYYIVDAFADRPFGGNAAGVVLVEGATFPEEELMLKVAAELRYSETVFVRRLSPSEFQLRYFTPTAEVELCGHATVAAFTLLHRLGLAEGRCLCHTLAGRLDVETGERVMMQMAVPCIVTTIDETALLYHALGLDGYCPVMPVQVAYSGLSDIMLQVPDVATLNALQPDMEAISTLTKLHDVVSFHVFALPALTHSHTAHVRNFAPLYGIPEESATGTSNAALTYYLQQHGVVDAGCDCSFVQGEAMGRPSVVETRLTADGRVYVGGTACVVAKGELLIDKEM